MTEALFIKILIRAGQVYVLPFLLGLKEWIKEKMKGCVTMNIDIDGQGYELNFGMGFIREMDRRHYVSNNGLELGMGVNVAGIRLQDMNPTILQDIVEAGLYKVKKGKPSADKIEESIETMVIEQGLEKTCNDFLNSLEQAPFTSDKIKDMRKAARKEQMKNESA